MDSHPADGGRHLDRRREILLQKDGSFRCEGYAPTQSSVKLKVKTDLKNITAFRLELLTDPSLPLGGPGRSLQGMGALDGIHRGGCSRRRPGEGHQVEVRQSRRPISNSR